jgi:hypothetical protein
VGAAFQPRSGSFNYLPFTVHDFYDFNKLTNSLIN